MFSGAGPALGPAAGPALAQHRGQPRGLGIDTPCAEFAGRPPRCVVLVPEATRPHADRVDEDVHTLAGPGPDRRREPPWPAPDRSPLLVPLGSACTDRAGFHRAHLPR